MEMIAKAKAIEQFFISKKQKSVEILLVVQKNSTAKQSAEPSLQEIE
jgi:hypothetical protein